MNFKRFTLTLEESIFLASLKIGENLIHFCARPTRKCLFPSPCPSHLVKLSKRQYLFNTNGNLISIDRIVT